jgi:hypothetical protein
LKRRETTRFTHTRCAGSERWKNNEVDEDVVFEEVNEAREGDEGEAEEGEADEAEEGEEGEEGEADEAEEGEATVQTDQPNGTHLEYLKALCPQERL